MMRREPLEICLFAASGLVSILAIAFPAAAATPVSGEAVYQKRCAACHDSTGPRVPPRDVLEKLSAARILRTLDFGVMMNVASVMTRDEREAVATFLGLAGADAAPSSKNYCADRDVNLTNIPKGAWNGWSPSTENTRYQPRDAAGLSVDDVKRLKLKWAYGFEGDVNAIGAPAVVGRYLFVGSAGGAVQALDAGSGCVHWIFQANGPVRSAMLVVPLDKSQAQRHALMFSDLTGWYYSLEATSGRLLWMKRIESHESVRLTGAAVAYRDMIFVPAASWEETRSTNPDYPCCTFRGSVTALRIKDGSQAWKTYTIEGEAKEAGKNQGRIGQWGPSGAGVWSSPTLDVKRGVLYVTTGDNFSSPATSMSDAVLALDIKTGRIMWSKQVTPGDVFSGACTTKPGGCPGPDFDFGSSALLQKLANGRELLFAGQKSGVVYALDPDRKGEIVWQTRVGKGSTNGGVQWGMASDGQKIYAAVSDVARIRRTNPDLTDPITALLDPNRGGGLTALRAENGEKVWYASPAPCESKPGCSPAQPGAVTAIPGVVFSGSMDGHVRAFSTEDGHVLWDFDTVRTYETANGVRANGGALDGAGPVVAAGMVFVNSGYSKNGGMPGNVLLAFAPEN
ncbi:MAG: cytochrome C oxidase Cbb3 [Acidobacteria bacterium]|nr:MAG: cytochrome C oxidase Cbb3 [Acidobacteriota bacterium]